MSGAALAQAPQQVRPERIVLPDSSVAFVVPPGKFVYHAAAASGQGRSAEVLPPVRLHLLANPESLTVVGPGLRKALGAPGDYEIYDSAKVAWVRAVAPSVRRRAP